jgi:hypothetical protein
MAESAPELKREVHNRTVMFSIVVSPFQAGSQVAGRRVGAKRFFFSGGGEVWEISCQFTPDRRRLLVRACDQIASSLRFR